MHFDKFHPCAEKSPIFVRFGLVADIIHENFHVNSNYLTMFCPTHSAMSLPTLCAWILALWNALSFLTLCAWILALWSALSFLTLCAWILALWSVGCLFNNNTSPFFKCL